MGLPVLALGASVLGAGAQVYSVAQQSKTAEQAAKFNADQARKAAEAKTEDNRENALRQQERNSKYLGALRTRMLEKAPTIEGGDADFLDEVEGDLQLRILDQSVANSREQSNILNGAFRQDFEAKKARSAGGIGTAAAALSGFNSIYSTGVQGGFWGQPKRLSALSS